MGNNDDLIITVVIKSKAFPFERGFELMYNLFEYEVCTCFRFPAHVAEQFFQNDGDEDKLYMVKVVKNFRRRSYEQTLDICDQYVEKLGALISEGHFLDGEVRVDWEDIDNDEVVKLNAVRESEKLFDVTGEEAVVMWHHDYDRYGERWDKYSLGDWKMDKEIFKHGNPEGHHVWGSTGNDVGTPVYVRRGFEFPEGYPIERESKDVDLEPGPWSEIPKSIWSD